MRYLNHDGHSGTLPGPNGRPVSNASAIPQKSNNTKAREKNKLNDVISIKRREGETNEITEETKKDVQALDMSAPQTPVADMEQNKMYHRFHGGGTRNLEYHCEIIQSMERELIL